MNLAELTIKNPLISTIVILISVIGGWIAYENMPRFEDPEFTIRAARIYTSYDGATPEEVADQVTETLETALQQLSEVEVISSQSTAGLSEIEVEIKYEASVTRSDLQGIWSKMRNKIEDAQIDLPSGAQTSVVKDDFGDVYGVYYLLTGSGFSYAELLSYAEVIQKKLLLIEGVAKVSFSGEQEEALYIEISREHTNALGASLNNLFETLAEQNSVVSAGDIRLGGERLYIQPTGQLTNVEAIQNLLVNDDTSGAITRLVDIATVTRDYIEPETFKILYNGAPAIAIAVSNQPGVNVVELSKKLALTLAKLEDDRQPIGMQLHEFYNQGKVVDASIKDFTLNVVMALVIVFGTLLVFMGVRSGLVMGATVLLTMMATLLIMYLSGIPMHRISLGALVISLGMLVDNGVVITDGMLVGIQQGRDRLAVARDVVTRNMKPLLGGTLVGIIAFAPIGFAPGDTAEYTNSLFWVVMIALALSWFFAFTITPWFCYLIFPDAKDTEVGKIGKTSLFMRLYQGVIRLALRFRLITIAFTLCLFSFSIYGFNYIKTGFFPASTTPQIVVDVWMPEGTDFSRIEIEMQALTEYAKQLDNVDDVQTIIGGNTLRYMLIYPVGSDNVSYAQLLLKTQNYKEHPALIQKFQAHMDDNFPEIQGKAWEFISGPGGGSKIEAVFQGPDPKILRQLASKAKAIMAADGGAMLIKDDWRRMVPVIQPFYSESKGERLGVSREDFADALKTNYSGNRIGTYREGDKLIPIISRAPLAERLGPDGMPSIQIISDTTGYVVPAMQVADGVRTFWRDSNIRRENRIPAIMALSDPRPGVRADDLFKRLRPKIEAIPLPDGYALKWEGEHGSSRDAQADLAKTIPMGVLAMILVVVLLFNKIRQPIIIWCAVPLAVIGISFGLIVTSTPLEFMGILGVLSLSGLLIQNSLVLVDHTDSLITGGMPRFDALIETASSRLRPVCMGAITTVLGVIPLYFDAFFKSMTVVLMFGLSFATLITLIITPVLYSLFFRIKRTETASVKGNAQ